VILSDLIVDLDILTTEVAQSLLLSFLPPVIKKIIKATVKILLQAHFQEAQSIIMRIPPQSLIYPAVKSLFNNSKNSDTPRRSTDQTQSILV
jgi:hypothetical protein